MRFFPRQAWAILKEKNTTNSQTHTMPAGYDGEAVSSRYITTLYWAMSLGTGNQIDEGDRG